MNSSASWAGPRGATAIALPVISCSGTDPDAALAGISPVAPGTDDEVVLADGLGYDLLISWPEQINGKGERFGFNNDYTAFFPIDANPHDGLLWVNHEEVLSGYFASPGDPEEKSREDVEREVLEVGGSIIRISRQGGRWRLVRGRPVQPAHQRRDPDTDNLGTTHCRVPYSDRHPRQLRRRRDPLADRAYL